MTETVKNYDLIIIGGGPAALTAAIYGGRAKLKTLVISKGNLGGQVNNTREIVNYPGFVQTSGPELMKVFKTHAETFGAQFVRDEVKGVDFSQEEKIVKTKKGREYLAPAVVIACGCEPRLLNIPGETRLRGNGVAYCATCDAEFFEGEDVVVIGSGDQAIEEGMYITKFARKVTVIVLHDKGILDCNKVSAERAFQHEKMDFIWNSTITEVIGEDNVEGVKLKNLKTGEITDFICQGVFFFVGMIPSTQFLKDSGVDTDKRGYIPVNDFMETNIEGVYAAGDNCVTVLRQVVSAAADGAKAAVAAEKYIEELNAFNTNILKSDKKVLLVFFNALDNQSLEFTTLLEKVNQELSDSYKIEKVDMATRKTLAQKYGVEQAPSVLVIDKGQEVKRLNCSIERENLKEQLL